MYRSFLKSCIAILIFEACQNAPTIKQVFPEYTLRIANSDSGKPLNRITKVDYFIIQNFRDSKSMDSIVAIYALKNRDTNWQKYHTYYMNFYKESKYTNDEHIASHPRDLDRYSMNNDWRYMYMWSNGALVSAHKVKDGMFKTGKIEIVETNLDSAFKK